jgi:hypothetical protein
MSVKRGVRTQRCAPAVIAAYSTAPVRTRRYLRAANRRRCRLDCSGTQGLSLLLPACHQGVYARLRRAMEKVGMRGRFRESERVETPPHRAEFLFSAVPCCPLPAIPGSSPGIAREAAGRCAILIAMAGTSPAMTIRRDNLTLTASSRLRRRRRRGRVHGRWDCRSAFRPAA